MCAIHEFSYPALGCTCCCIYWLRLNSENATCPTVISPYPTCLLRESTWLAGMVLKLCWNTVHQDCSLKQELLQHHSCGRYFLCQRAFPTESTCTRMHCVLASWLWILKVWGTMRGNLEWFKRSKAARGVEGREDRCYYRYLLFHSII